MKQDKDGSGCAVRTDSCVLVVTGRVSAGLPMKTAAMLTWILHPVMDVAIPSLCAVGDMRVLITHVPLVTPPEKIRKKRKNINLYLRDPFSSPVDVQPRGTESCRGRVIGSHE